MLYQGIIMIVVCSVEVAALCTYYVSHVQFAMNLYNTLVERFFDLICTNLLHAKASRKSSTDRWVCLRFSGSLNAQDFSTYLLH